MQFINNGQRIAGLVVPLLSLRKNKNAACGAFSDLLSLGKIAKKWGLSLIQLLPLNDTGNGPSPYAAISAFALHPIYISLSDSVDTMALLGLPFRDEVARELVRAEKALNCRFGSEAGIQEQRFQFEAVLQLKINALRKAWDASRDICSSLAEAFAARESWAKPYACFVALRGKFGLAPWWEWPECQNVLPSDIDKLWFEPELAEEERFRLWLQVLAQEQLRRAAQAVHKLGIDIMGDIPILLAKDSADVWFQREIFILDKQAGAPPDMYSPRGQNWGFPLYDWDALRERDYSFWRQRLQAADSYYTAYRIDHVLGFFRIWAISIHESDAYLGTFEPSRYLELAELKSMGFSDERIAWLSKPHISEWKIREAEKRCLDAEVVLFADSKDAGTDKKQEEEQEEKQEEERAKTKALFAQRLEELGNSCFVRIKNEPLFLFRPEIIGTADIDALFRPLYAEFPKVAQILDEYASTMRDWWIDRALYQFEPDRFVFQWSYRETTSWKSLSLQERAALEAKAEAIGAESLDIWEKRGRELLSMLVSASEMQAFAEDLGAVPPCVPKVLRELKIPGLRVMRWEREWDKPNQPHIPFERYEPLSVACTSVHDSTNLRQWWQEEADRLQIWAMCRALAERDKLLKSLIERCGETVPERLGPGEAAVLVRALALSGSIVAAYPVQDILACHPNWRSADPRDERINVPGTTLPTNWMYRMPIDLSALVKDEDFAGFISEIMARGAQV